MKRILVRLKGGLGNQMFQYAAGYALMHRWNAALALEARSFDMDGYGRKYALGEFALVPSFASKIELAAIHGGPRRRIMARLLLALRHGGFRVVNEEDHTPTSIVLPSRGIVVLNGYWQQYEYFGGWEKHLLSQFQLGATRAHDLEREWSEIFEQKESVAVHVRRMDYVDHPSASKKFGVCDTAYYHAASKFVARKLDCPQFFVFSDDPMWCERHLTLAAPSVIVSGHHEMTAPEELWLMSKCRHFVLSNSTFGWWSAWLGTQTPETHIVVAPKKWRKVGVEPQGLLPASWFTL